VFVEVEARNSDSTRTFKERVIEVLSKRKWLTGLMMNPGENKAAVAATAEQFRVVDKKSGRLLLEERPFLDSLLLFEEDETASLEVLFQEKAPVKSESTVGLTEKNGASMQSHAKSASEVAAVAVSLTQQIKKDHVSLKGLVPPTPPRKAASDSVLNNVEVFRNATESPPPSKPGSSKSERKEWGNYSDSAVNASPSRSPRMSPIGKPSVLNQLQDESYGESFSLR